MPGQRRGIPASQLARDYGVSLNEFASAVIDVVASDGPAFMAGAQHRREVCAAVSAAMSLALEATSISDEERACLQPLMQEVLLPFWMRHCSEDGGDRAAHARYVTERATHYLARRVPGSHVKSAVNMVTALLEALGVPEARRTHLTERLAPAFAHRMVGDVYRINEVRSRQGIELSMLATVSALLQITLTYDPVLRMLRFH
jgi:hypothetical protein